MQLAAKAAAAGGSSTRCAAEKLHLGYLRRVCVCVCVTITVHGRASCVAPDTGLLWPARPALGRARYAGTRSGGVPPPVEPLDTSPAPRIRGSSTGKPRREKTGGDPL